MSEMFEYLWDCAPARLPLAFSGKAIEVQAGDTLLGYQHDGVIVLIDVVDVGDG